MTTQQNYLREQLRDVMRVIDTCLAGIYAGETHMFRPLAGQLRILLCDTQQKKDNSLLVSAFPKLEVSGLSSISWSESKSRDILLRQPPGGEARIAEMPFEITVFSNGLVIADFTLARDSLVPIGIWASQMVTFFPTPLSVFDIVRTVADKGGGSHVDANPSPELRYLAKSTPGERTYGEMFILAVGRFVQKIGEKLFNYEGVQVSSELFKTPVQKLNLTLTAHREWAEAQTTRCR